MLCQCGREHIRLRTTDPSLAYAIMASYRRDGIHALPPRNSGICADPWAIAKVMGRFP